MNDNNQTKIINGHLMPITGIFTCECGYQWKTGENGNHHCNPQFRERINVLESCYEDALEEIERLQHRLKETLEGKARFAIFDGKPIRVLFCGHMSALGAKLLLSGVAAHTSTITREKGLPDDVAVYLRGDE